MTIAEIKMLAENVRDGFASADASKMLARAIIELLGTEDPEEALAKAEAKIQHLTKQNELLLTLSIQHHNVRDKLRDEVIGLERELERCRSGSTAVRFCDERPCRDCGLREGAVVHDPAHGHPYNPPVSK